MRPRPSDTWRRQVFYRPAVTLDGVKFSTDQLWRLTVSRFLQTSCDTWRCHVFYTQFSCDAWQCPVFYTRFSCDTWRCHVFYSQFSCGTWLVNWRCHFFTLAVTLDSIKFSTDQLWHLMVSCFLHFSCDSWRCHVFYSSSVTLDGVMYSTI